MWITGPVNGMGNESINKLSVAKSCNGREIISIDQMVSAPLL